MKKFPVILSIIALSSVSIFSSCKFGCKKGSGHATTEHRVVSEFSRLDIDGAFTVTLKQDSSSAVTLTGDDNLLKYITTDVSGGKLRIHSKSSLCSKTPMTVVIGVRSLDDVKIAGAIELSAEGKLNVKDFNLDLAGANKITLDINAANMQTTAAGASELNLKGQASAYKVKLSGRGELHAFDLVVGSYRLETAGSSDAEINVLKDLSISSAGASDVKYKGNPTSIHNDKAGAGTLEKVQ